MHSTPETPGRFVLWLLGPTSSGKTTIADHLVNKLKRERRPIIHYDGDEIRDLLGTNHGFSSEDRLRVVNILVHLANKNLQAGCNVIVSALTAHEDARRLVRDRVKNLLIGHVTCSLDTCIRRDPKGLYKRAIDGEINTLIGYNTPYAAPENPDLILQTERSTPEGTANRIYDFLRQKALLSH